MRKLCSTSHSRISAATNSQTFFQTENTFLLVMQSFVKKKAPKTKQHRTKNVC
eukprot:07363.XXX_169060_169218_1 [CDS] Oithona nana genome sequencing.